MRRTAPDRPNPVMRSLTVLARILFFLLLGGLVVLVLTETPSLGNLLSGRESQPAKVGLVAGHWQNDSGAVCPDGLQEVELNLAIARRVADLLRDQGYQVDVLPEFSPKLDGYHAAVFVSIHNDSCVRMSGFKIASQSQTAAAAASAQLETLLYASYQQATGLQPDLNTITDDMRQYHAWRQIAADTPAAIIECGFMGGDRALLTDEPGRVAEGIANGLVAFLSAEEATPAP
jgi:N-acetylmuramoyl-L-alanine amidase